MKTQKKKTSYEHMLRGLAFFSNADTIATLAEQATNTWAPKKGIDYRYFAGASIACSTIGIILISGICIKKCFNRERDQSIKLPSVYLAAVFFSCLLSITGSSLLIYDQSQGSSAVTDIHIAGAFLFGIAKLINPVFSSTLIAGNSLEESNEEAHNNEETQPMNAFS